MMSNIYSVDPVDKLDIILEQTVNFEVGNGVEAELPYQFLIGCSQKVLRKKKPAQPNSCRVFF